MEKRHALEEGVLVSHLYRRFAKSFGEREFAMFEQWIDRYVTNWSNCDGVSTWLIAACDCESAGVGGPAWPVGRNPRIDGSVGRRQCLSSQEAKRGRNTETILHICDLLTGRFRRHGSKRRRLVAEGNVSDRGRARSWNFSRAGGRSAPRLVLRLAAEKMSPKDRRWLMAKG